MKVTLPETVVGSRDTIFILKIEFPVSTVERQVVVEADGPVEALDLNGTGPGGDYGVPVGLESLHVPLRVTGDGAQEARVGVRCTDGPEAGEAFTQNK